MITVVERQRCAKRRQIAEPDGCVLGEALRQIIRQCFRPRRIFCQGQGKGSTVLHLAIPGKRKRGHRPLPCFRRVPEKSFLDCRSSFPQTRPLPLRRLLRLIHRAA